MSAFVDRTLRAVLFQEPSEIVSIIPKRSGLGRIRTGDLRLVKAPEEALEEVEMEKLGLRELSRKFIEMQSKKVGHKRLLKTKDALEHFIKFDLTPEGMYEYLEYLPTVKSKKTGKPISPATIKAQIQIVTQFLDYVVKNNPELESHINNLIRILKGEKPKGVTKQTKTPLVVLKDVHNVLRGILNSNLDALEKLRYAVMWLLKSSTGLRSEMFKQIKPSDLKLDPVPHMFLKETKISYGGRVFEHYIPIHSDLLPYLKAYIKAYKKSKPWKYLFDNDAINRKVFQELSYRTIEENQEINFQAARYFFEQFVKWDLPEPMNDELRRYLMAHEVGGISADFYDRATPKRIYNMYMHYMKNAKFIPADCKKKLDELIKELA